MKIMLQDVLKEMRERQGLKQSEVAEYVGVTTQTYMKWENGKNEPKASNLRKLAEILKVTEVEICRGERFQSEANPIEFMKKVAKSQKFIDDVTFTSILFDCIQDKTYFIARLEIALKETQGFTSDDIDYLPDSEKYAAELYKEAKDREINQF